MVALLMSLVSPNAGTMDGLLLVAAILLGVAAVVGFLERSVVLGLACAGLCVGLIAWMFAT